jgi:hypothetical protein
MVSKCANPDCFATFRYLHAGKLFRLETHGGIDRRRSMGVDTEQKKCVRRIEFFWLCDQCARSMTVEFANGVGVSVRPTVTAHAAAA